MFANLSLDDIGRMAYYMEATKWVVGKGPKAKVQKDEFSELRKPFENEQLAVVDNLSVETIPGKEKLYALAAEVGMLSTLRWKPRMVRQNSRHSSRGFLSVCGRRTRYLKCATAQQARGLRCRDRHDHVDTGHHRGH